MAKATKTIESVPVTTYVDKSKITLELSQEEAQFLRNLMGKFSCHKNNNITNSLWKELYGVIEENNDQFDVRMNTYDALEIEYR